MIGCLAKFRDLFANILELRGLKIETVSKIAFERLIEAIYIDPERFYFS